MCDVLRRLGAVLILAAGLAGAAGADDGGKAYALRYRFAPDDVVHFRVTHAMTFSSQKADYPETATNQSDAWKHYRVLKVHADGSAKLELVIDRVVMSARFNSDDPVTVDSRKPDECPAPYQGVLKTVGRPLVEITVSPSGKLLAAERVLPDDVRKGLKDAEDDDTPDTDPGKNPLVMLPEQPVRIGESWQDDIEARVNITRTLRETVTLRRRYTLEGVEGSVARITLKTVILTPIRDPTVQVQLIQRAPQGVIEFDMERGSIVSRTLTVDESVVGAMGPNSLVRAVSRRVEKRLTPAEAAAEAAAAPKAETK